MRAAKDSTRAGGWPRTGVLLGVVLLGLAGTACVAPARPTARGATPPLTPLGIEDQDDGGPASPPAEGVVAEGPATGGPATTGDGESASASDPEAEAAAEEDEGPLHGSVTARFRSRATNDQSDADAYLLLSLDVNDPDQDAWSGHLLGRLSDDLNGDRNDPTFFSIDDTYSNGVRGRLYEAWVDLHTVEQFDLLRFGRQSLYDTPADVVFDGLHARLAEDGGLRAALGVYGGRTHHEYESSPAGDDVFGTYVSARPWSGGRARIDYMHLRDALRFGDERNDLLGVGLWQSVAPTAIVRAHYTALDHKSRDAELAANWYDAEDDLSLHVSLFEQFDTEDQLVTEADPYFVVLQEYKPYRQARLLVSKGFDDDLDVQLGGDVRVLKDKADEGEFNREFNRYFVTTTVHDVAVDELAVSVTGEVWGSDQGDYRTWGLDFTKPLNEEARLSVGSTYALYVDDFLLNQEREDVRSYYARLRYRSSDATTWSLGYEYEDADIDDFQTLTAKLTWRF